MVTRPYFGDEEPSFRRYSSRGHGYPITHDRLLPPAPVGVSHGGSRNYQLPSHDPRNNDHESEQDSNSQPRRRIAVACGRCRKRKIRCSGDPGNGGPCANCKSAGNDSCQFLRVSSTEAQMKTETADFGYDAAAARQLQCRMASQIGAYGSQAYAQQIPTLTCDGLASYRTNSIPTYQYPVKSCYPTQYGTGYDENLDYGMQSTHHQIIGPIDTEYLNMPSNYGTSSTTRGWTPAPQVSKTSSSALFLDQDSPATCSPGQLPYHGQTFPVRSAMGADAKQFSLGGMATSLPAPSSMNGNDRLLPIPAANRPAQSLGSFLRSSDSILPSSQSSMQTYNGLIGQSNMLGSNSLKTSNSNALAENASISSSYLPLSTSPEAVSSSQIAYDSQALPSPQHSNLYSSTNESLFPGSLSHEQTLHSHDSTSDLYSYGPSTDSSKRGSQGSQSNGSGELSNSHDYVPLNSASYLPRNSSIDMAPAATHRRSAGSLRAA